MPARPEELLAVFQPRTVEEALEERPCAEQYRQASS
jgi:hypothetical protein